jgi:hypothetical protein
VDTMGGEAYPPGSPHRLLGSAFEDAPSDSIHRGGLLTLGSLETDEYRVKAAIDLRDGVFRGAHGMIWFMRAAFSAFVSALL